jgi:TPR repeat protein
VVQQAAPRGGYRGNGRRKIATRRRRVGRSARAEASAAAPHEGEHGEPDATPAAWAAYSLASIYRNGYAWLEHAAQHGVPQAQFQLANIYRERGDAAETLIWLRQPASAELPEANLALAMAYRNGELGLHRDDGEYWTYVKETLHDYKHRVVQ